MHGKPWPRWVKCSCQPKVHDLWCQPWQPFGLDFFQCSCPCTHGADCEQVEVEAPVFDHRMSYSEWETVVASTPRKKPPKRPGRAVLDSIMGWVPKRWTADDEDAYQVLSTLALWPGNCEVEGFRALCAQLAQTNWASTADKFKKVLDDAGVCITVDTAMANKKVFIWKPQRNI